jgi:hypothetical protein
MLTQRPRTWGRITISDVRWVQSVVCLEGKVAVMREGGIMRARGERSWEGLLSSRMMEEESEIRFRMFLG